MKKSLMILALALSACNMQAPKYNKGDCITPTDPSYTWYGKYAEVEAFSKIKGYSGRNYILTFPYSGSNNSIFSQDIETYTERVNFSSCS